MLKITNNKFIAVLLCFIMIFTTFVQAPVTAVAQSDMTIVNEEGKEVNEVTLYENEKPTLSVKGSNGDEVQWQIYSAEHDLWINILGENSEECVLSFAKVSNMLDENDQTKIRCVKDNAQIKSNEVEVTVEPAPAADMDTEPMMFTASRGTTDSGASVAEIAEGDSSANVKQYSVVINYLYKDNTIASSAYGATLAENSSFRETLKNPTVVGYAPTMTEECPYPGVTFTSEAVSFNIDSVTSDMIINVIYQPAEVNYTVVYFHQNANDDKYIEYGSTTKRGRTNDVVPEIKDEFAGFYPLEHERPTIAADGSTVVEVYYDREYYLMYFELSGGYGTEPVYARYGAPIGEVVTPTKAGHSFVGWAESADSETKVDLPTTMPAESRHYYAIWAPDATAKVSVVFWGENANDGNYSYLETKTLYVKPGTTLTYSENGDTVCGAEEHSHDDCERSCGKTAHSHGTACYTQICGKTAHASHTESCYACNVENHTHGKGCYANVGDRVGSFISGYLPDDADEGEVYRGSFNLYIYIKGSWYNYNGSTSSGSIAPLTCGKIEQTHKHSDACGYKCGGIHTHSDYTGSCYKLTCTNEVHTHSDACGYSCGKSTHEHSNACKMPASGLNSNLWEFDRSETVTVAADGSTVINVYYNRTQKTLIFNYDATNIGNSYNPTYKYGKQETITAKWGADISAQYVAIAGRAGGTFWSKTSGSSPYTNYFGVMPQMQGTSLTYYYWGKSGSSGTMTYYGEGLDGQYAVMFTVPNVGGYTVTDEDRYTFEGFTYDHGTANNQSCKGAAFYYTRNTYDLVFNNGYEDVKTEDVKYEASLSPYGTFVPEVPITYEPGSVRFAGWYWNPECTGNQVAFNDLKMPAKNQVVYAKWEPVTHQVTFYKDETALENNQVQLGPIQVLHGQYVPQAPEFDDLVEGKHFVGWFYMDNGVEKAFDFEQMPIKEDMNVYGKWTENAFREYSFYFKVKNADGTETEIADPVIGSARVANTKTIDAKGGLELYKGYQEGWFPITKSHSIKIIEAEKDENGNPANTFTFYYEQKEAVPYTVKYLEKGTNKELHPSKTVSDNRQAIVTETFEAVDRYMPDAYQKRLVINVEEGATNEIIFYYTKDEEHAYYKVSYYIQDIGGNTYTEYTSSEAIGTIGNTYTAPELKIPGFVETEVNTGEYVTLKNGELTEDGLHLKVYYNRKAYPYIVLYEEYGSGKKLLDPVMGSGIYGAMINPEIKDIVDYTYKESSPANVVIRIEELADGAVPELNKVHVYYTENQVTINYRAETGGTVNREKETINVLTGYSQGSTATADDAYTFLGWYNGNTLVSTDMTYVPVKVAGDDGKLRNVAATYTAKFDEKEVTFNYVPVTHNSKGEAIDSNAGGLVNNRTGVISETLLVKSETAVGGTATATADYEFKGWYKDEACTEPVTNTDGTVTGGKFAPAKGDHYTSGEYTYYALFEEKEVTITYRAETGGKVQLTGASNKAEETSETLGVLSGDASGATAIEDSGYSFIGWFTESGTKVSDEIDYIPQKVLNKNLEATYIAKFEENTVDISYVLVAPEGSAALSNTSDDAVKVLHGNPEGSKVTLQPGYSFEGWYTDASCSAESKVTSGLSEGGMKLTPQKKDGLYKGATYYAKVVENKVTINYEAVGLDGIEDFGGVSNDSETIAAATGTAAGSRARAEEGYRFIGWFDNAQGTGTAVSTDAELVPQKNSDGIYENSTYYAVFAEKNVTINYVIDGDDGCGSLTREAETVLVKRDNAEGSAATANDNYNFIGWYDADGKQLTTDATFTPAKVNGFNVAATYYAKFVEKQATVQYVPVTKHGDVTDAGSYDGGKLNGQEDQNISETTNVLTGSLSGAIAAPKADYTFGGWYDNPECTGEPVSTNTVFVPEKGDAYTNAAYYALFVEDSVQISYEAVGPEGAEHFGSVDPASESVLVQTGQAKGSTAEAGTYYDFAGWYDNAACRGEAIADTEDFVPVKEAGLDGINRNVEKTYYAKFVEKKTTVTYEVIGPEGSGDIQLNNGESGNSETAEVITGTMAGATASANKVDEMQYAFVGWYADESCTELLSRDEAFVPQKVTDENGVSHYEAATYYAKFEEAVQFTYIAVTEENSQGETVQAGFVSLANASDSESSVFEFVGKYNDEPVGATAAGNPSAGYKFVGWYTDAECTQAVTEDIATVNGNLIVPVQQDGVYVSDTFYAKFSSTLPHLTIFKEGVEKEHSVSSFIFRVKGKYSGFETTVVIRGNGSVTLKNMIEDEYTVTEITDWNIDYKPVDGNGNYQDTQVVNIETAVDEKTITFRNQVKFPTWLSGDAAVLNEFTPFGIDQEVAK